MEPNEKKAEAPKQPEKPPEATLLNPGENAETAADRQPEEFRAQVSEAVKPGEARLAQAVDKAKTDGWNVA